MIGYVTLGTDDIEAHAPFYDALCSALGVGRMMQTEHYVAWGIPGGGAGLGLTRPHDGKPASVGNGTMVALEAPDRQSVDTIHALALSLGGTDEGQPGERMPGFYAGYFRDPAGNKLNVFAMG